MESHNKWLAREFFRALGANDQEALKSVLAEDAVATATGQADVSIDRDRDVMLAVARGLQVVMKDGGLRYTIQSLTEEDNRVSCECHGAGVMNDGTRYDNQYHFLFEIKNAKIYRFREYMDTKLADSVLIPPLVAAIEAGV